MRTGISRREKVLVFLAVVIVVAFSAFHFAINPLNEKYTTLSGEFDKLLYEKTLLDEKLSNEDSYITANAEAKRAIDEIAQVYPMEIPHEEVDKILTGICVINNLKTLSLGMSDKKEFILEVEEVPVETATEDAAATEDTDAQNALDEEEKVILWPAAFSTITANMNLYGSYDSLKGLISSVEKEEYLRISKATFSYEQIEHVEGFGVKPNIAALFELTMLNDIQKGLDMLKEQQEQ